MSRTYDILIVAAVLWAASLRRRPQPNYMSLAGYLRFKNHQRTNKWLTYKEAAGIVAQQ